MDEEHHTPAAAIPTAVSAILILFGLILAGVGIFALVGAILAAWNLFHHPEGIGGFADYVLNTAGFGAAVESGALGLAHAAAWVVVVLLLLLLGRLGAWAVIAGAQLVGPRSRSRG